MTTEKQAKRNFHLPKYIIGTILSFDLVLAAYIVQTVLIISKIPKNLIIIDGVGILFLIQAMLVMLYMLDLI